MSTVTDDLHSLIARARQAQPTERVPDPEPLEQAPLSDFDAPMIGGASVREVWGVPAAQRRVLEYVATRGGSGATDREIACALDANQATVRDELVAGGWLCDSGRERPTGSGRDAVVWVLTEQAWRLWNTMEA